MERAAGSAADHDRRPRGSRRTLRWARMRYPFDAEKATGYIDETGRVVMKPKHVAAGPFVNGVAHAYGHNEHVFFDEKGRVLFRVPQTTHYEAFGPDGLAYFSRWDLERGRQRAAFRDRSGKERALDFDDASSPHEGLAAARRDRGADTTWIGSAAAATPFDASRAPWGYIDVRGKSVIEPRFVHARAFHDGRAAVARATKKGPKWGYIDAAGTAILPMKYDGVTDYADGLASIGDRDRAFVRPGPKGGSWDPRFELAWGLVDAVGKKLLPARWRSPLVFRNGHSPGYEEPFVAGVIDRKGRFVGPARYRALHPFEAGAAGAHDPRTGRWGVVAPDGTWLLAPTLESLRPFVGPLAHFTRRSSRTPGKSRYGYVDTRGEIVFERASRGPPGRPGRPPAPERRHGDAKRGAQTASIRRP